MNPMEVSVNFARLHEAFPSQVFLKGLRGIGEELAKGSEELEGMH